MTPDNGERLYTLLPFVIRMQDEKAGGPLRELCARIQAQSDMIEGSIDQMYDDMFIQSCSEWVIPYIGELVGADSLTDPDGMPLSRDFVGRSIAYRKRKGTVGCMEQVVRDATGFDTYLIEYYRRIARTQNAEFVTMSNAMADLRAVDEMEDIGTPFDATKRNVDVRSIAIGTGSHNINNLAVLIWPLRAYRIDGGTPRLVDGNDEWSVYTFDAFGERVPLWYPELIDREDFNVGRERSQYPGPVGPWPLVRASKLRIVENGRLKGVPSGLFTIVARKGSATETISSDSGSISYLDLEEGYPDGSVAVAVDLLRGTFALRKSEYDSADLVDYSSGYSGMTGGGPYHRYVPTEGYSVLQLLDIDASAPLKEGKLEAVVASDATFRPQSLKLDLDGLSALAVRAGDHHWPCIEADIELDVRKPCRIDLEGIRLLGELKINGPTRGLDISIRDCTINGSVHISADASDTGPDGSSASIADTIILDGLQAGPIGSVSISGSIIKSTGKVSVTSPSVDISKCTILGQVEVDGCLTMVNSIVTDVLLQSFGGDRRGCISYSALPQSSKAARFLKCVKLRQESEGDCFTHLISQVHGDPHFCQLDAYAGDEILRGASTGSEMGAFCDMNMARTVHELGSYVRDYLPVNLEEGIRIADQRAIKRGIE